MMEGGSSCHCLSSTWGLMCCGGGGDTQCDTIQSLSLTRKEYCLRGNRPSVRRNLLSFHNVEMASVCF